ncbi:MAG TPA: prenyltransferase [Streptosporangiaceae bacterium]
MPSPDFLAGSVSNGHPQPVGPAVTADRSRVTTKRRAGVPDVPGVLTAAEVLATAEHIAGLQEPGGAISWPDGHTDAWDHIECAMALSVCGLSGPARRAYGWLRETQRADGSWPKRTEAGVVTDAAAESNQTAYVAVGTWHEYLLTGDRAFLAAMWPVVRRAIGFVLDLQLPRGEIVWQRLADGTPAGYALLTGCSSTYQSLVCAARLARLAGEPQPRWEQAARRLGHVVACHPGAFADKSRYSMDWYYPVLAGPVRGPAARARLDSGWAEFVVPGLGVRCVSDEPWVTGAETCELVMALDALGDSGRALRVFAEVQHLRDADGGYWTGWQYADQAHFPDERSSWTAAAMILAADALSRTTPGSALFRDLPAGTGRWPGPGGAGARGAGGAGNADGAGAGNADGAGAGDAGGAGAGWSGADGAAPCGWPRPA